MGFDLKDSGFHIMLAKDVPEMIGAKIGGLVSGFLERNAETGKRSKDGSCIPAERVCLGQCGKRSWA